MLTGATTMQPLATMRKVMTTIRTTDQRTTTVTALVITSMMQTILTVLKMSYAKIGRSLKGNLALAGIKLA